MRLIDANNLMDLAQNNIDKKVSCNDIARIPAVDAEVVKHGHWIICSDGYYPYCSECHTEPDNGKMSKYCPECGAKMDGEKK